METTWHARGDDQGSGVGLKRLFSMILRGSLCAVLAASAGCKLEPARLADFGTGLILGGVVGSPFVVVIHERVCYQNDAQIPCPADDSES